MGTTIHRIRENGQSIWCDNLSREMIDSGGLAKLIEQGIVGVTSNPSIFMKAITGGKGYDETLQRLLGKGRDTMSLYEGLVLPDIADAADVLRKTYDDTNGLDGYVSLEVNPKLAFDTDGTIAEAKRLFAELNRPNVFIKIPATDEGIPAIEAALAEGINVNVTLIFAIEMYERVMDAYIAGVRRFADAGGDPARVASVASFFVSRVDAAIDKRLAELDAPERLQGKAAIANAKLAYERFQERFDTSGPFGELAKRGARVQRPLWASTSTKNPDYPDTLYVDTLIGEHTVNTLPPATIDAVLDHGETEPTLATGFDEARAVLAEIESLGISLREVTDELTQAGVKQFVGSFDDLLTDLETKRQSLRAAG